VLLARIGTINKFDRTTKANYDLIIIWCSGSLFFYRQSLLKHLLCTFIFMLLRPLIKT